MRQPLGSRTLQGAVILLGIWSLVRAHGHDEDGVVREIAATVAAGAPPQLLPSSSSTNISETAPSYFNYQTHGSLLYAHIVFMSIAWVFVLPPALALSIARSRVALPVQISFLVVHALGLVTGAVYNRKTPDLYPQNVHHGLGWLLTIVVAGQTVLGLIGLYARPARKGGQEAYEDEQQTGFIPVSMEALAEYHRIQPAYDTRFSRDSGQGTERVSNSIPSAFSSPRDERPDRQLGEVDHHEDDHLLDDEKSSTKQGQRRWRLWISALTSRASGRVLQIGTIVYNITDRLLLPLGFAGIASGIIVYSGIFHGKHIFNGLAHFVKGGIFVWYGFLTLGRWMGCFADLGWAWNVRPEQKKPTVRRSSIEMPSAEFIESAVIFIYGASNVFLEHLAAWGEAWTAQDFEHVSISIMFFGGGLAGMLVESKRIRNLLNASIMSSMSMVGRPSSSSSSSMDPPKTYRFSMNPFPALIIMLLGMMMSSHHQMSMISTMMHKQRSTRVRNQDVWYAEHNQLCHSGIKQLIESLDFDALARRTLFDKWQLRKIYGSPPRKSIQTIQND
ncbi:MAG: hypothetical protein M1823_003341 [Watsoniomyces obsoletus]|nr:MAG: hypothetical protein M1823_003341 [Watsoniomyces obsoletus]